MQSSIISFQFEDNGRFHDDLVLRLGNQQWRCDSYYLLIDDGILADQGGPSKVRAVLRRLLDQWQSAVAALGEGDTCYLPYDFSDQYTGWLRCEAVGSDLKMQRGWAEVEGYSFNPSDVGELFQTLSGFHPDGREVVMPRKDFHLAIGPPPAAT
jgi:hypothetical protein